MKNRREMPPFHPAVRAAAGASSSLKLRLSLHPPRQSCLMHRNMHRDRLFRIKLSHALLSVDSSVHCVLGMWFIYTALKFWGLKWMNAETGCLKKASKQQGLLPLPASSDVSNSPIHLPGRDVHEEGHASPLSEAPKMTSVWLHSRNRSLTSQAILLQSAGTQGTWGALRWLPPLPENCLTGRGKILFSFCFTPFLLSPHTISPLLLFSLQVGTSN